MDAITEWPDVFSRGEAVVVNGQRARVDSAYHGDVPAGQIPVRYESEPERIVYVFAGDVDTCPQ
jgi:hypothetical protein